MSNYLVEFKNVSKSFPGVHALKNVSFGVIEGSIHCLIGENGAGKSTLIKIFSGIYEMDSGAIILSGRNVIIDNPRRAQQLKISFIYQEQNLVPQLSIEENITLGTESSRIGILKKKNNMKVALDSLLKLSLELNIGERVSELGYAEKQMVAIAKALHIQSKLIVMDEASGALTIREQNRLFDLIKGLKEQGVTVIYISHNLDDVFKIGDYVTVLRDGEHIETVEVARTTREDLIRMMVGKDIIDTYAHKDHRLNERLLSIKHISRSNVLNDINIDLYKGEIIGVYGLLGSGRTELARVLFGVDSFYKGDIILEDHSIRCKSPKKSIQEGISLIPEDRRKQGIIGGLNVRSNISLPCLPKISRLGVIRKSGERKIAQKYIDWLNIKTPSMEQQVQFLSGGNQQKVVISKMLTTNPKVLLMDEPTRGIDVGAKAEVFRIMRELADSGSGIIMFSSELAEVLKVSDRILIMYKGTIIKELLPSEASQDIILHFATGGGN